MISPIHDSPFGPLRQPINKIKRCGVSHRNIITPKITRNVKASIKRHKYSSGNGRIFSQAFILFHSIGKNHINRELVSSIPAFIRENPVDVFERWTKTCIGSKLAHVGPEGQCFAVS
ncbi:hypothetical protein KIW84_031917 [Lathyrus oleraceus]|uniref:Uncharacterized protein n=1 Tax=Pisum sativum TaxID=3888 RepID=A0A9D4XTL7_PEA|nr:hypothetical protein KIW84_031917 [Pisum sativum]